MLYEVHEMSRAAAAQMRMFASTQEFLLNHPLNPFAHTVGSRSAASACRLFEDLARRYYKPSFRLATIECGGKTVAVRETNVKRKTFCQLKHFERDAPRRNDPRLLIVAPLSGHFATLLRGTVETLLPDHDVFITDWRDARMVPVTAGGFGLDEYVDYMIDFLDYLGPDTHVLAVCQAAVPMLAATALMAEDQHPATPRSLAMMSAPIDARVRPTLPDKLATTHSMSWFRRHTIHRVPAPYPGMMRPVYPGFMQLSGFVSMNFDRHVDAYWRLFQSMIDNDQEQTSRHRRFYDEYMAVMDLPAAFYLDTIRRVFKEHHLARGCFSHRGRPVDTAAIRDTALFTIEGERDDISSPGQTAAAHALCPNIPQARRRHHEQAGVGHYGVFNGRHWRGEIAPKLAEFIRST